ncbi:PIN domain-containing protein [Vineibacter terrae]|uniref:Ribonuclease VapC n=1 Tax=Vineibacter terrae TaxID=2586908 RepID=A0A5C8P8E8_9HYPH|nr:PIN domain-containing protein [Vineibacter terrae]TXL69512.1 PIN domain-containing protein [Vineibacter terrae]
MILVDTSVWVDYLRAGDKTLASLLVAASVVSHPFVVGELALGFLRQRSLILQELQALPQAIVATDEEVLRFIDQHRLFGLGIGYVDAHLLASVRLTDHTSLWTRDKRLGEVAQRLGVAAALPRP